MVDVAVIKILANESDETLERAINQCKGTNEAKARAMKEIKEYREIRNMMKTLFK